MGTIRWIFAFAGWIVRGPVGALTGYLIGYVIERGILASRISAAKQQRRRTYYSYRTYQDPRISELQTAYSSLGISPNATDDEIKSAYRRLAMQNHPDTVASQGSEAQRRAESRFKEIQEAYLIIKKHRNIN